jgi:hypothetical protein
MLEKLKWTFKMFAFTLIIPICASIINILFVGILGLDSNFGFIGNFKVIWVDYYFTGTLIDIIAWKWHLSYFLFCFIINLFNK